MEIISKEENMLSLQTIIPSCYMPLQFLPSYQSQAPFPSFDHCFPFKTKNKKKSTLLLGPSIISGEIGGTLIQDFFLSLSLSPVSIFFISTHMFPVPLLSAPAFVNLCLHFINEAILYKTSKKPQLLYNISVILWLLSSPPERCLATKALGAV